MVDESPLSYDQDLGSLAPFTPPSTCLDRITSLDDPRAGPGDGKDRTYFVGMIGNAVDKTCYPPSYSTDVIYPTGSCPSGWASACFPTLVTGVSDTTLTLGLFPTGFPAVQCCPSGFTCYDPFFCGSSAPPTEVTALLVSPTTATVPISISSGDQIWAKPIFVVSATRTPAQSTGTGIAVSTSAVAASSCPATETGHSSGLSTEGKIALAAVIPATVLAIIVAGLWFLLGRRPGVRQSAESPSQGDWPPTTKETRNIYAVGELPYTPALIAQHAEMDATTGPVELNAGRRSMQPFGRSS